MLQRESFQSRVMEVSWYGSREAACQRREVKSEEEEEGRGGTGKAGGGAQVYFTLMGVDFGEHLF